MGYYSAYNALLNANNSGDSNYHREHIKQVVEKYFDTSSNVYTIQRKTRNTNTFTDIDVRLTTPYEIVSNNKMKDDFFQILFKDFDYQANLGDIFEFNNNRWMVIKTSNIKSVTNSCLVQRCNIQLKFTTSTPLSSNIITIDGIADNTMNGVKDDRYIMLPNNQLLVSIPYDDNSLLIKSKVKPTRFILGNPKNCWVVEAIDSISNIRNDLNSSIQNGFIQLRLKESQISTKDRVDLNVAWQDYF